LRKTEGEGWQFYLSIFFELQEEQLPENISIMDNIIDIPSFKSNKDKSQNRDQNNYSLPKPEEILQKLIQYRTVNPPGNEKECVKYISSLLTKAGFQTTLLAKDPTRPNLITRLKGKGTAPALLFYGHIDVVTTRDQKWTHPPFAGVIEDGYLWGRGALDMKGGIAMMLYSLLKAKKEGFEPAGDIVLAIVSDEEAGSDFGARYLVDNYAELFKDIKYAIGEFGGFSFYIGNKKFYPIQIAEKQVCWLKATVHGNSGHGSFRFQNGSMSRMATIISKLEKHRLPVHISAQARQMILGIAKELPQPKKMLFQNLVWPHLTDTVLNVMGSKARIFDSFLHNTVNPTIVNGGNKINVIPSKIELQLDGRILPGYTPSDLISEIKNLVGNDIDFEVLRFDYCPVHSDMGMFELLSDILKEADPDGVPIPYLLNGYSDARLFSRLGIQTYGYLPMNLPDNFKFTKTIHGANERIPIDALYFGVDALIQVLKRYRG